MNLHQEFFQKIKASRNTSKIPKKQYIKGITQNRHIILQKYQANPPILYNYTIVQSPHIQKRFTKKFQNQRILGMNYSQNHRFIMDQILKNSHRMLPGYLKQKKHYFTQKLQRQNIKQQISSQANKLTQSYRNLGISLKQSMIFKKKDNFGREENGTKSNSNSILTYPPPLQFERYKKQQSQIMLKFQKKKKEIQANSRKVNQEDSNALTGWI